VRLLVGHSECNLLPQDNSGLHFARFFPSSHLEKGELSHNRRGMRKIQKFLDTT